MYVITCVYNILVIVMFNVYRVKFEYGEEKPREKANKCK